MSIKFLSQGSVESVKEDFALTLYRKIEYEKAKPVSEPELFGILENNPLRKDILYYSLH